MKQFQTKIKVIDSVRLRHLVISLDFKMVSKIMLLNSLFSYLYFFHIYLRTKLIKFLTNSLQFLMISESNLLDGIYVCSNGNENFRFHSSENYITKMRNIT